MEVTDFSFNSIKVRLRHSIGATSSSEKMFQFHKGTIKTVRFTLLTGSIACFNSIKVRLRQGIPSKEWSTIPCFNSIKVRLRRRMQVGVRLEVLFQFHKGTIKTPHRHMGEKPMFPGISGCKDTKKMGKNMSMWNNKKN